MVEISKIGKATVLYFTYISNLAYDNHTPTQIVFHIVGID